MEGSERYDEIEAGCSSMAVAKSHLTRVCLRSDSRTLQLHPKNFDVEIEKKRLLKLGQAQLILSKVIQYRLPGEDFVTHQRRVQRVARRLGEVFQMLKSTPFDERAVEIKLKRISQQANLIVVRKRRRGMQAIATQQSSEDSDPEKSKKDLQKLKTIFNVRPRSRVFSDLFDEDQKNRLKLLIKTFRIFGIDTVESKAFFLAHAALESKGLTEPLAKGDPPGVKGYPGRGPLHVTNKENYEKAFQTLKAMATELRKSKLSTADLKQASELEMAEMEIRKDPKKAEEWKYGFLLSGAYFITSSSGVKSLNQRAKERINNIIDFCIKSAPMHGRGNECNPDPTVVDPLIEFKFEVYKKALNILNTNDF